MNMLKRHILKIHSVEPFPIKNVPELNLIQVTVDVDVEGMVEKLYEHITTVDEWEEEKQKGYFLS